MWLEAAGSVSRDVNPPGLGIESAYLRWVCMKHSPHPQRIEDGKSAGARTLERKFPMCTRMTSRGATIVSPGVDVFDEGA
ncbi:hypothetical protein HPB48_022512 [Haemaphysalis longicornis]|uniref:Uncharacterized protein n=1 Tax=Haemaphysalis longicornis TaxID=44386 RepID=A0A9J6FB18_HAELO|nr:hypothetical protein HPB48_022512 [Haemaphysalis longicornis]